MEEVLLIKKNYAVIIRDNLDTIYNDERQLKEALTAALESGILYENQVILRAPKKTDPPGPGDVRGIIMWKRLASTILLELEGYRPTLIPADSLPK